MTERRILNSRNPLQEILKASDQGRKKLEDEMERAGNPWLMCFTTRMHTVKMWLGMAVSAGFLERELSVKAEERFRSIKEFRDNLEIEHPEPDFIPDEETQSFMFTRLNVLVDPEVEK